VRGDGSNTAEKNGVPQSEGRSVPVTEED